MHRVFVEFETVGRSMFPLPPLKVNVCDGIVQFAFIALETGWLYSRCVGPALVRSCGVQNVCLCLQSALTRLIGVAKCALDSLTANRRGVDDALQLAVSATSGRLRRQSVLDGNEHELEFF